MFNLSCSKIIHKDTVIEGTVINGLTNQPIDSIEFTLTEYNSSLLNIGNSVIQWICTTNSNSSGEFEIFFDAKEAIKYSYSLQVTSPYSSNTTVNDYFVYRIDNISKNKVNEVEFIVAPPCDIIIIPNRNLINAETLSYNMIHEFNDLQHETILNKNFQQKTEGKTLMGTWTINYKYRSTNSSVWDWEKTDTFWVDEGQTYTYVIEVD